MKLNIWIPIVAATFLLSGCYTQLEYTQRMHRVTDKKPVKEYSWSDKEEAEEQAEEIYIEDNEYTTSKPYDVDDYEQQAVYEDEIQPVYKDYESAKWYYDNGLAYDGGYYRSYIYNHLPPSYWYPYYYDPFYDYPYYGSIGFSISFRFGSYPWWYYPRNHYFHHHFYHHHHHSFAFWHPFYHHHYYPYYSIYGGTNFIVFTGTSGITSERNFGRRSIGTNRTRADAGRRGLRDQSDERRRSIGTSSRAKIRDNDNRRRATGRSRANSNITRKKDTEKNRVRSTGRSGSVNRSGYRTDTKRSDRKRSYTPRTRKTDRPARKVKSNDGSDLRRSAVGIRSNQRSRHLYRNRRNHVPSRIDLERNRAIEYKSKKSRSGLFNRMLRGSSIYKGSRSKGVRRASPKRKTIKAPTRKVRSRSSGSRSSSTKKRSSSSKRKKRGDG